MRLHDVLKDKAAEKFGHQGRDLEFSLPDQAVIKDLIIALGFDPELVGLVVVNGKQGSLDKTLAEQDLIELFTPMAGG